MIKAHVDIKEEISDIEVNGIIPELCGDLAVIIKTIYDAFLPDNKKNAEVFRETLLSTAKHVMGIEETCASCKYLRNDYTGLARKECDIVKVKPGEYVCMMANQVYGACVELKDDDKGLCEMHAER